MKFARKLLLNLPLRWSHKWPPVAWQLEKFPGRGKADGATRYMLDWFGYAEHWEALVAAWDEDADFAVMWPAERFPFVGLYSCIKYVHTLFGQIRPIFDGTLKALPDSGGHCSGAKPSSWSSLE